MKSIKSFTDFSSDNNTEINESFGSYYFHRNNFDGFELPAKGETKYAVIAHNKVEVGGEKMTLRTEDDYNVGAGFRPVVLFVVDDEASAKSAYDLEVKKGGSGAKLSHSYGKIIVKSAGSANVPYTEIDGITKKLK